MAFWTGWETWEKLVFVLVHVMVGIILTGALVRWYQNRKVKRLNKAFAAEAERVRNIRHSISRTSDVPFGARALESGLQVDGVFSSSSPRRNIVRSTDLAPSTSSVMNVLPTPLTPTVTRASQYEYHGVPSPRK